MYITHVQESVCSFWCVGALVGIVFGLVVVWLSTVTRTL